MFVYTKPDLRGEIDLGPASSHKNQTYEQKELQIYEHHATDFVRHAEHENFVLYKLRATSFPSHQK